MVDVPIECSVSFADMPVDAKAEMLKSLTALELVDFRQQKPSLAPVVESECNQRYDMSIDRFIQNKRSFNTLIDVTGSFISGSAALKFGKPDVQLVDIGSTPHDLDIYVKRPCADVVLNNLRFVQGYSFSDAFLVANTSGNLTGLVDKYYTRGTRTGIDRVYTLKKGDLKIDVIVAASNLSALFPVLFFHSTPVMNVLTPSLFVSLYPDLTFNNKGVINPVCMADQHDFDHYGSRVLRPRARSAIDKYILRGFDLRELDDFDIRRTYGDHMFRSSVDNHCLKLQFSSVNNYTIPDPFFPVVTWTLGGVPAGKEVKLANYINFHVHTSV